MHEVLLEARERLVRRQVREHELGPRGRRAGRDRPVRRAVVDDLARLLERGEAVAADAGRVEVLHQAGRGRAGEPDARGADLAEREQALAVPVGDEVEVLLARVLDAGALDPRVEPLDVDELRAAPVGALRDRADHVLLAGLAGDRDHLAGLDVGAEADDDVGEAAKRGVIHPSHLTEVRRVVERAQQPRAVRQHDQAGDRAVVGVHERERAGCRSPGGTTSPITPPCTIAATRDVGAGVRDDRLDHRAHALAPATPSSPRPG